MYKLNIEIIAIVIIALLLIIFVKCFIIEFLFAVWNMGKGKTLV